MYIFPKEFFSNWFFFLQELFQINFCPTEIVSKFPKMRNYFQKKLHFHWLQLQKVWQYDVFCPNKNVTRNFCPKKKCHLEWTIVQRKNVTRNFYPKKKCQQEWTIVQRKIVNRNFCPKTKCQQTIFSKETNSKDIFPKDSKGVFGYF